MQLTPARLCVLQLLASTPMWSRIQNVCRRVYLTPSWCSRSPKLCVLPPSYRRRLSGRPSGSRHRKRRAVVCSSCTTCRVGDRISALCCLSVVHWHVAVRLRAHLYSWCVFNQYLTDKQLTAVSAGLRAHADIIKTLWKLDEDGLQQLDQLLPIYT